MSREYTAEINEIIQRLPGVTRPNRIILLGFYIICIFAPLLNGCLSDSDFVIPGIDSYNQEIAEGWIRFDSGDYSGAIGNFRTALEIDPLRAGAYVGLGWCYAKTDNLDDSLANLDIAITKDSALPDAYAAKAFVKLADNSHENAISAAEMAISLGGEDYMFSQIPEVRTSNLRLLIAECYYTIGRYEDAQSQIDIIKPDNKLDKNSCNYKRDLIAEIENLKSDVKVIYND